MKLEHRLYYWAVVTLIGFGALGIIINTFLPTALDGYSQHVADQTVWGAFYAGIFLCVLGFCVLVGYGLRWLPQHIIYPSSHSIIIRQGTLIALGVTVLAILQSYRVLSWWDALLLAAALLLVELSFHARGTP